MAAAYLVLIGAASAPEWDKEIAMQINEAKINVDFRIDGIEYIDGFITQTIVCGDARDDIAEIEMTYPVEDLGDGEWAAEETDAESIELEAVAIKLEIDAARLLAELTRTGFEAWLDEGALTDMSIQPGVGCVVDVKVEARLVKAWKDQALVAA